MPTSSETFWERGGENLGQVTSPLEYQQNVMCNCEVKVQFSFLCLIQLHRFQFHKVTKQYNKIHLTMPSGKRFSIKEKPPVALFL